MGKKILSRKAPRRSKPKKRRPLVTAAERRAYEYDRDVFPAWPKPGVEIMDEFREAAMHQEPFEFYGHLNQVVAAREGFPPILIRDDDPWGVTGSVWGDALADAMGHVVNRLHEIYGLGEDTRGWTWMAMWIFREICDEILERHARWRPALEDDDEDLTGVLA